MKPRGENRGRASAVELRNRAGRSRFRPAAVPYTVQVNDPGYRATLSQLRPNTWAVLGLETIIRMFKSAVCLSIRRARPRESRKSIGSTPSAKIKQDADKRPRAERRM